jgi:hypothetical protein
MERLQGGEAACMLNPPYQLHGRVARADAPREAVFPAEAVLDHSADGRTIPTTRLAIPCHG